MGSLRDTIWCSYQWWNWYNQNSVSWCWQPGKSCSSEPRCPLTMSPICFAFESQDGVDIVCCSSAEVVEGWLFCYCSRMHTSCNWCCNHKCNRHSHHWNRSWTSLQWPGMSIIVNILCLVRYKIHFKCFQSVLKQALKQPPVLRSCAGKFKALMLSLTQNCTYTQI